MTPPPSSSHPCIGQGDIQGVYHEGDTIELLDVGVPSHNIQQHLWGEGHLVVLFSQSSQTSQQPANEAPRVLDALGHPEQLATQGLELSLGAGLPGQPGEEGVLQLCHLCWGDGFREGNRVEFHS